MTELTLRQALRQAQARLAQALQTSGTSGASACPLYTEDDARVDAEMLLTFVLGQSRTYLFTWPERLLDSERQHRFETLVAERARGVPVAYLLGEREFWSMPLRVTPDTLIPRADTERLVELALACMAPAARVLDLGTGTGAIALALASERPDAEMWAVDASSAALAVARENAARLGLCVRFEQSDWFAALGTQRFDLIVSNPPYIAARDQHLEQGDLRFEPRTALISGDDGLDDIRQIINLAPRHLTAGGWLLLEHGFEQGAATRALLTAAGFSEVATVQDYAELDRVSRGRWEAA